jgi:hypothetical protein
VLGWQLKLEAAGGRTHERRHTTFTSVLLSREDIEASRPEHRPVLDAWGEARRTVLELTDGERTLGEIERLTFERHRELFVVPGRAAELVAEVLRGLAP